MDALERTLPSTRRVLGDVDPAQPLDTTHPLLDGLEGLWLPLPGLTGGSRLYDLSGYNRHSTLNGPEFFSWSVDASRPLPLLSYEPGVDEAEIAYHQVAASNAWKTPFTLLLHVYYREWGASSTSNEWNAPLDTFADNSGNHKFSIEADSDSGNILSAKTPPGLLEITADGPGLVGDWHTIAITHDGNDVKAYLDDTQTDSLAYSSTIDGTNGFRIGGRGESAVSIDGFVQAITFFDGAKPISQIAQWDREARRGFPDLLNRRDTVGLLGGGGGGTADTVSFNTGAALADGFEPTITATANTVSSGTAQAAAQGFSATITATQNTVSAGTAQATAQGFEPAITTGSNTVAATTGQAAAQGFDPTISEGAAGDTLVADLGTAQAQGFVPTITTNPATVTLGLGQATANGFDPDVVADPSEINTGQAQAAATGFDPTITTNARNVAPQLGTAQAQGFEPAVVDGTVGVATTMEIEARPLYEIDVEAKPLYRIRLFVKEQLP